MQLADSCSVMEHSVRHCIETEGVDVKRRRLGKGRRSSKDGVRGDVTPEFGIQNQKTRDERS